MKISIITPAYNEEKTIQNFLKACEKIKGKTDETEFIIVNDGSSDNTKQKIIDYIDNSKLNIKLVDFTQNQGRLISRIEGAKSAKHENLLFIDAKCEPFENILLKISEENYEPICGNVIQDDKKTISRFFYLTRKKLYGKFFGNTFENVLIDTKNFDKIPKGTTVFYTDKKRFLKNQPDNKSQNCSDDTSLLWNIVQEKPILKSAKVKIFYNTRSEFFENIKHIFNRGPKFIDYYYIPSKPHFWLINLFVILTSLSLYLGFTHALFLEISTVFILIINIFFIKNHGFFH